MYPEISISELQIMTLKSNKLLVWTESIYANARSSGLVSQSQQSTEMPQTAEREIQYMDIPPALVNTV